MDILPICCAPTHILVQRSLSPNHRHVWIIHNLWSRRTYASCIVNLKVLFSKMGTYTTFQGPFPSWSGYQCLTSKPQFRKVFHLYIFFVSRASPWCLRLILPSGLNYAIWIVNYTLVEFLGFLLCDIAMFSKDVVLDNGCIEKGFWEIIK
jgi:hypothetical protein